MRWARHTHLEEAFLDFIVSSETDRTEFSQIGMGIGMEAMKNSGQYERDLAFFIESIKAYLKADEMTFPERLSTAYKVHQNVFVTAKKGPAATQFLIYSGMTLPAIHSFFRKHAEAELRMRAVSLALAAASFKAENGSFPESVMALTPRFIEKPPLDVWTHEPLEFRVEKGVYGVFRPRSAAGSDQVSPTTPLIRLQESAQTPPSRR